MQGFLSTKPGFKEISSGRFESTHEGIQSEITGFNAEEVSNIGPVEVSCTAPAGVEVYHAQINGEGSSTTTSPSSTTTSTTSSTTSSSTTTTTSSTTSSTTSVSTTTTSRLHVKINDKLTGSVSIRKLGFQKINLPEGCTFIGEAEIPGSFEANTKCPPFTSKLKIFGLPATIGLELVQSEPVKGTIVPQENGKLKITGTAKENIKVTSVGLLGLNLPVNCQTAEPVVFGLSSEVTVEELLTKGTSSSGETKLPAIHCSGFLSGCIGSLLTILISGPNNPYVLAIEP